MSRVEIWTDGACSGNPGPGGWGAILKRGEAVKELSGGEAHTTNNRMELTAAISALEALTRECGVDLYTDSQYLRQGILQWMHGWKRNGWRTADKKPVKNEDLWRRLDDATQRHEIEWRWVKGHAGEEMNERADELARLGMKPYLIGEAMTEPEVYEGLTEIFHDLFADPSLVLTPAITAADVRGWDSFNHINIVAAAEERFGVRFTTREIEKLANVGDLVAAILMKAKAV